MGTRWEVGPDPFDNLIGTAEHMGPSHLPRTGTRCESAQHPASERVGVAGPGSRLCVCTYAGLGGCSYSMLKLSETLSESRTPH